MKKIFISLAIITLVITGCSRERNSRTDDAPSITVGNQAKEYNSDYKEEEEYTEQEIQKQSKKDENKEKDEDYLDVKNQDKPLNDKDSLIEDQKSYKPPIGSDYKEQKAEEQETQKKAEEQETQKKAEEQETQKKAEEQETQKKAISIPEMPSKNSSNVGYNDKKSWWFKRNSNHTPPTAQSEININQYDAYYLGDIDEKVIYLTFDEGYELGYTEQILNTLQENDVKAAFFVTGHYIDSEPELVKRMVDEGHIVGNHTLNHPDLPDVSDKNFLNELEGCAQKFKDVTGMDMPKYIRPPAGVYSISTLEKTKETGYKTIFWSFAYQDWDPKNQPGKKAAYDMVVNNHHNGCIMLLHAVSQSNTEALNDIIISLKNEGYTFASLDELPYLKN